jgi:zinc/manganese transport system substrate-binding protein
MPRQARRIGLALLVLLLTACGGPDRTDGLSGDESLPAIQPVERPAERKLRVVATTSILGDVVGNVVGDAADLTVLIPPGQDPHSYQLTARQQAAVEDADLIFANGFNLEESLLTSIEATATGPVVPASAGIAPRQLQSGEAEGDHKPEGIDPHVWMDVQNVMTWTQNIAEVLAQADPTQADTYVARANAYREQLITLDADMRQQMDSIPADRRKLVTDHDSLGYFADAYGFQIVGAVIPGFSTTAGANAGDLARLTQTINDAGVSTIFIGTTSGDQVRRLVQAITAESGRNIQVLSLYSGSLDAPGTPADTYIGMMQFDTQQIVSGLSP